MKDKKERSPQEIKADLAKKYGKGKLQRHKEINQDYSEYELDALKISIQEKYGRKVLKDTMDRQENERTKKGYFRTRRMGYAVVDGVADKQSKADKIETQQERNKHAKELLEYKYTKLSSARSFDKASDPATKEKKYLKAKSKNHFSKEK